MVKKFKHFILENAIRPSISASGMQAASHKKKYIDPHVGGKNTHTIKKPVHHFKTGDKVSIHKTEIEDGKTYVHISSDKHAEHKKVLASKLAKPGKIPPNKGFKYEIELTHKLHKHGIATKETAGATAGTDFKLINKKKQMLHPGKISHRLNGEAKGGRTAAFGQITLAHNKKHGWHIPAKNRENRPGYSKHVDKIKVGEKSIYEYLNDHHHPDKHKPQEGHTRHKTKDIEHHNLEPANAYLADHHAHVVQVKGHGLYKVGDTDKTGHGLPKLEGKGRWRIRQKTPDVKKRTVQFMVPTKKSLPKSHVDLDKEEDILKLKKTLGHK